MNHQTDYTEEFLRGKELEEIEARKQQKLDDRFGAHSKPWHKRNKGKRIYAFIFSYVFNFISLLGLGYTFSIVFELFGIENKYIGYACAIPFMFLFEKAKRFFSDAFWDYYHSMKDRTKEFFERISWSNALMNFVVLFGISLGASVWGMYYLTKENAPEAKYLGLTDDVNASALLAEVEQIKTAIKEKQAAYDEFANNRANRNSKGEFYHKNVPQRDRLFKAVEDETAKMAAKEKLLNDKYGVVMIDNQEIKEDWKTKNNFRIYFVLVITLLSELFFEICMSFMSRYDYEVYKLQKLQGKLGFAMKNGGKDLGQNGYTFKQEKPTVYNEIEFTRTQVKPFQNRHTVHDTRIDTQPETRVPRDTQPTQTQTQFRNTRTDTDTRRVKKAPEEYVKMVKRIRTRYAKSFEDYPGAPKNPSQRQCNYDLALEEWEQLEEIGYKISKDPNNKFRLKIVSPKIIEV